MGQSALKEVDAVKNEFFAVGFDNREDFMEIDGGKQIHTVEEILALPEGVRAELLDGEMFMMASPALIHQDTLVWLNVEIWNYIRDRGGKCKVLPAPFGVFLKNDDKNYVEPDIVVICNRDRLDERGCHGAPDWAIEIVSPSSKTMDYYKKLEAYSSAGVREYWVVDPVKETVVTYDLEHEEAPVMYHFTDSVKAGIFEELVVDFSELKTYLSAWRE